MVDVIEPRAVVDAVSGHGVPTSDELVEKRVALLTAVRDAGERGILAFYAQTGVPHPRHTEFAGQRPRRCPDVARLAIRVSRQSVQHQFVHSRERRLVDFADGPRQLVLQLVAEVVARGFSGSHQSAPLPPAR